MSKEQDKKNVYNQMAWILNYQPTIKEQHIHMGEKTSEYQQETKADDEKRKRLMATNTIIRSQTQSGQQAIDILKLYNFIDRYFASEISYKYERYALRRFLEKYNLLRDCDNEQFAGQMNNIEWFGALEKRCEANEMNYYNYLNSVHPDKWVETEIQLGSRATKRSVSNVYRTYSDLELYKDQIIGR
ncbi:MAG: hypothetical protein IJ185_05480 [Prevotella sp.]|nr:hypothetical protein [Prevotella sp.]